MHGADVRLHHGCPDGFFNAAFPNLVGADGNSPASTANLPSEDTGGAELTTMAKERLAWAGRKIALSPSYRNAVQVNNFCQLSVDI